MFRKPGLITTVTVMILLIAACTDQSMREAPAGEREAVKNMAAVGTPNNQIVLRFANWASAEQSTRENIEKVIADFEASHPNVKIENIAIPFDQVRQQLITMSAGGNPPDIAQLSGPWAQELGPLGVLRDLNEFITPAELADHFEGGLQAGTYDGKLYAIPFGLSPHGLWYNKKLLAQAGIDSPPKTMDELNAAIVTIRENLPASVYPIGVDTTKIDYALVGFWPWMLTYGARPMYNGDINFNTPATQQAFAWLQMITQNGYTPLGQQIKEERELMAKGQIAMKLDGPYTVGILRSLNPDLAGEAFYNTFGVTTVPMGNVDAPVTLADIHQLGMSTQTRHPDVAWEFIRHLVGSNIAIEAYLIPMGMIPPLKSTVNKTHAAYFTDPVSQVYINEIIPSMIGGPYNPQYGAAQQFVIQGMQEVALSNADVSETLDNITNNLKMLYGME
jgi:multiple sugar transport system substrate-binding protein